MSLLILAFIRREKTVPELVETTDDAPELSDRQKKKIKKIETSVFSEKMTALLDSIERRYPVKNVSYFSYESGKWISVMQKMGGIVVRGETIYMSKRLLAKLGEIDKVSAISLNQRRNLFIPLLYRSSLIGGIYLAFVDGFKGGEQIEQEITDLCTGFAHSIFLQRIYDIAVRDPDTDFFTYPYFYFMIKEWLKSNKQFATMVFEIEGIETATPKTMRRWAMNLQNTLKTLAQEGDLFARLDRGKFAIIFNLKPEIGGEIRLNKLEDIPSLIQRTTGDTFQNARHLSGGFFIRPANMEDADSFMQRLEYQLINCRLSGSDFSTPRFEIPKSVYPGALHNI
jgi:hypothetical protein